MARQFRFGITALGIFGSLVALILASYLYPWKGIEGRTTTPGVAFSLTPNYGTAAIHYSNGTTVSVARVEGTQGYRNFMRRDAAPSSPPVGPLCEYTAYIPTSLHPVISSSGLCASPNQTDINSVETLMRDLRTQVASHVGTDFCYAGIVIPSRQQADGYQRAIAEQALRGIGLVQPSDWAYHGGPMALMANGLIPKLPETWPPLTHDPAVILAVEHGVYGSNMDLMYRDEDGILDHLREDFTLGYAVPPGGTLDRESFRRALAAVVGKPFPESSSSYGKVPDEVRYLVLYGENVNNPAFQEDLRQVLGGELVAEARASDPVFVAARQAAEHSEQIINSHDFRREPALGCCLASVWHNCWEHRMPYDI